MRASVLVSIALVGCVYAPTDPAQSETSGSSDSTTSSEATTDAETSSDTETTGAGDESDTGTDTGDSTGETGEPMPTCEPSACEQTCGEASDECGIPLGGECLDDVCMCHSQINCMPCIPEDCPDYASCPAPYTQNGVCMTHCSHGYPPFHWDPNIGCTIQLLEESIGLEMTWSTVAFLDGMPLPRVGNCDDPQQQDAWHLAGGTHLVLCSEACARFEMGAALEVGWSLPCD